MSGIKVSISGADQVRDILRNIAPNEAKNLMRATVVDMAKQAARDARENAPKDSGNLASAIGHKRDRGTRGTVSASVGVAKSAFYWRFLEYGDGPDNVEHAMFLKAAKTLEAEMERLFLASFGAKLEARLVRARNRAAKGKG